MMHRAYQPLLPATNRYLQEKWDTASYWEHRRKVHLAAPMVNTAAPPTPFHLQVNLKKQQLQRERQAVQQWENLLHAARLRGIEQSQGRVDNWNFYCPRSLNGEKRQRDFARICWENQQLAKRLEGRVRSELAQEHWQRRWQQEERLRNSIARYPRAQVRKGRRCQADGSSDIPTPASPESPGPSASRSHLPLGCRTKGGLGRRFWESRGARRPLAEEAASLPAQPRVSSQSDFTC